MGKINWGRVILGGLLAGVVINVVETMMSIIFMEEYQAAMEALGITMEMGGSAMAFYLALGFVYGIFAVWLYAAIRPRYGAGPKTAVVAGFAVWFIAYLMVSISFGAMGLFPARLLAIGTIVGLAEIIVATLLGAWLYKEAESA